MRHPGAEWISQRVSGTELSVASGGSIGRRSLRGRLLGWGLRLASRFRAASGGSLLDRLPPATRTPLQRDGIDPVPDLLAGGPVRRLALPFGLRGWLVTGHAECRQVLGDADAFSNDFGNLVGVRAVGAEQHPGGLGFIDPPDHTRLRTLIGPHFTRHRLARLRPFIEGIVADRLEALERAGREAPDGVVDLYALFAVPVPALTIAALLGVDEADRDAFVGLCGTRFDLLGGVSDSLGSVTESLAFLSDVVARQRQQPGDGLLGRILDEHGDEITDHELAGLADGVLTGGFESTASMLALSVPALLRDESAAAALRTGGPDEVAAIVEELLRLLTVVQVAFPRFAQNRVTVGSAAIEPGDVVLCSLLGADRDGVFGEDPSLLRPGRPGPSHLAFGHGLHRCVGAELARLELRIALPALLRRFPGLVLAGDRLDWRELSIVYGVDALPVRW